MQGGGGPTRRLPTRLRGGLVLRDARFARSSGGGLSACCNIESPSWRGAREAGVSKHEGRRLRLSAIRAAGERRPLRAYRVTTTLVPIFTRLYRSTTSSLVMRMQPEDTAWPIDSGSLEPWMR